MKRFVHIRLTEKFHQYTPLPSAEKRFWSKNCVYYPWKQIADRTKSVTAISPAWMISALLTRYRNSKDMMEQETQYLDTCHMSEYTWRMFTNNGAHVMDGGMQCTSVLFDFYYCDTLFLYAHVSILMIFKMFYVLLMWKVMLLIRIIV